MNNSTISTNRANYGYGGAIYLSNRSYYANVYNSTISANISEIDVAGIYNVSTYGNVDIVSCREWKEKPGRIFAPGNRSWEEND